VPPSPTGAPPEWPGFRVPRPAPWRGSQTAPTRAFVTLDGVPERDPLAGAAARYENES